MICRTKNMYHKRNPQVFCLSCWFFDIFSTNAWLIVEYMFDLDFLVRVNFCSYTPDSTCIIADETSPLNSKEMCLVRLSENRLLH